MNTRGQTIKSFGKNELLNRKLDVSNYPIRKRGDEELNVLENIKRLRRVNVEVLAQLKPEIKKVTETIEDGTVSEAVTNPPEVITENASMLFEPIYLTTKERRRFQSILLKELVLDQQKDFNAKFLILVGQKQEEIAKIEEKNDRILAIISQLQVPFNL
jgi:hypothetical protein